MTRHKSHDSEDTKSREHATRAATKSAGGAAVAEKPSAEKGEHPAPPGSLALSFANESLRLYNEWARTMLGLSDREVPAKDPRFSDPVWRENPLYKTWGQGYLAFCEAVDRLAAHSPDWRKRERAKFLTGILTSALSPTNTLVGNPAALKRFYETGGMSLLDGMKNFLGDVVHNKGMPSQVKPGTFKVGENLAATPGAVVFRNEMVELLQYQPTTAEVTERPTLLIVPPIGKYYFMDLAPKRSFVEYAVARGISMFVTSWRNPQPKHGHWGLDEYVQSCLELVDAACEITGSEKLNVLGMCAGGIITSLMLAVMAARGDERVNAAAFGVMLLDFGAEAPIGTFSVGPVLKLGRRRSASKGVLPASDLAGVFAWMRPNDLVWNYWSNNYLMGKDPPAFDILAWSVDGTNLPGKLHGQFLDIFEHNPLPRPGALSVAGVPIDLGKVRLDALVTGALTDHLTPWKACYRTTQLLGGKSTFVLSNSGHIASLVNPPGNPKASYWLGPEPGDDPERWLEQATKKTGTWWEVWADWTLARSGGKRPAPEGLGSARYPALSAAPGEYVLQPA
ncbi:MAG TPA: alpha/beta fold hydrolase [Burkholderiaceae bacterium]|nr:alpha/beta fold hydrolase [Burkholderiaceae bacterium]